MSRRPKFTKEEIVAAIKASEGDLIKAAVALQVTPSTVYRSIQRYGIEIVTERRVEAA